MLQTKATPSKKVSSTPGRSAAPAKPSGPSAATARQDVARGALSPEERHRLIAEAAYFRALARGFCGGDPLEDWLTAEEEIDRTSRGQEASPEKRAAS